MKVRIETLRIIFVCHQYQYHISHKNYFTYLNSILIKQTCFSLTSLSNKHLHSSIYCIVVKHIRIYNFLFYMKYMKSWGKCPFCNTLSSICMIYLRYNYLSDKNTNYKLSQCSLQFVDPVHA